MIRFTFHTETRLIEKSIDAAWVIRAVERPDWVEPDANDPAIERRFSVVPEFGARVLRVAVRPVMSDILVLTATWDRNATRKFRRGERP